MRRVELGLLWGKQYAFNATFNMIKIPGQIRLTGGILPYVIVLCLILSVFCGSFILSLYYHSIIEQRSDAELRIYNNLRSGKELILASQLGNYPLNEYVGLDLFGDAKDSVLVMRQRWGAYIIITTKAIVGRNVRSEVFLIAQQHPILKNTALYLSDIDGTGLVLVGTARITGDAYLPKQGVNAGYLGHRSFIGKKLIDGERKASQSAIPSLSKEFCQTIKDINETINDDCQFIQQSDSSSIVVNSFLNPTLKLFSHQSVLLDNNYEGKVIISSSQAIEVSSRCKLKDVILRAPTVKVKSNFKGSAQIVATDSIIIEDNVKLTYPSVLICNGTGIIKISNNSRIAGGIYHLSSENSMGNESGVVYIGQSEIIGQVVSTGSVELLGAIVGQLICNRTIYRDYGGGIYSNYLVDCVIDNTHLPDLFVFPDIFEDPLGIHALLTNLN